MFRHGVASRSLVRFDQVVPMALTLAPLLAGVGCTQRSRPVGRLGTESQTVRLVYPECATLTLTWTPTAQLAGLRGEPRAFVHLLRPGRTLVRTFDHDLAQPWVPGESQRDVVELCQSSLAEPLAAGTYDLTVGLYDRASGARFALVAPGDEVGPREFRVATIETPMQRGNAPRFDLSSGWDTVETGADKQVLARRWLLGSGALQLAGIDGPGLARLALQVPEPGPIRVRLSSTCGERWAATVGPGFSVVRVPVGGGKPAATCELRFAPEFPAGFQPDSRTVGLESLAWIPAASSQPQP